MSAEPFIESPESVGCSQCGAEAGQPCDLDETVTIGAVTRRAVHAARFAENLPPEERVAFWERAVDRYFDEMDAADAATPTTERP